MWICAELKGSEKKQLSSMFEAVVLCQLHKDNCMKACEYSG